MTDTHGAGELPPVEQVSDKELLHELAQSAVAVGIKANDTGVKAFAYEKAADTYGYLTQIAEYEAAAAARKEEL